MPELDDDALISLRENQKRITRCKKCTAQTWKNYCRACDEFFTDGHWATCKDFDEHSSHRKY